MLLSVLKVVKFCKSMTNVGLKYLNEFVIIFNDLRRNNDIIKGNFSDKSCMLKAQIWNTNRFLYIEDCRSYFKKSFYPVEVKWVFQCGK